METIHISQGNCVDLTENHPVYNWINDNTSNRTIKFFMFRLFPLLFYYNLNSTHYRYCGPMLAFAEHFTKMTKTRYISFEF